MTDTEAVVTIVGAILSSRVWSMIEHRQTGKDIHEIKIYMNGDLEKIVQDRIDEILKKDE